MKKPARARRDWMIQAQQPTPAAAPSPAKPKRQDRRPADRKTAAKLHPDNPMTTRKAQETMRSMTARMGRSRREGPAANFNPFKPPEIMKGVLPKGTKLAMDDAVNVAGGWAASQFQGSSWGLQAQIGAAWDLGITFMGYPFLSYLAQIPEYRNISETIATEMTRKWIRFRSKADENEEGKTRNEIDQQLREHAKNGARDKLPDLSALLSKYDKARTKNDKQKPEKVKELEDRLNELQVRDLHTQTVLNDGLFGRSHLYLDTGDTDDPKELVLDIGPGRGAISQAKVNQKNPLRALRAVEPTWSYPSWYNATNPLAENWYKPERWYVMATDVHHSRFLTYVGRPVPDLLKPVFSFGGLSLSQMVKPAVDNWLRTRQGVGDIINAFSIFVLATDMASTLNEGGDLLFNRIDLFNATRDNRGTMAIDKNTEDFLNVAAPLSGLAELQGQSQEHMFSIARIPIVKGTGIQPHGLNADSDGVIRVFYDTINAGQNRMIRPNLDTIIYFTMLSLWGEVDEEIVYDFEPLWELDELQRAEMRHKEAQTDDLLVQGGIISPEEVRERIASDPTSPYPDIDPDDVPEPPMPQMGEGGFGAAGGLGGKGGGGGGGGEFPSDGGSEKSDGGAQDEFHPTKTKQQVNYRLTGAGAKRCGACSMYRPNALCTLVFGSIDADIGLCDEFDRKKVNGAVDSIYQHGLDPDRWIWKLSDGEREALYQAGLNPENWVWALDSECPSTLHPRAHDTDYGGAANLAEQGLSRNRFVRAGLRSALQKCWREAVASGKAQTLVSSGAGLAMLHEGEMVGRGQPHIIVTPTGDAYRFVASARAAA